MKGPSPCLMFSGERHGKAEEAMNLYISIVPGSRVLSIEKYGAGENEPEGTVKLAVFLLNGQEYMAMDSNGPHAFNFTPSVSFFLTLSDLDAFNDLVARFSDGGQMLMPPDDYGFSRRFAWFNDRFGVSWQINCV